MRKLLLIAALLGSSALAQVTTNPAVTGVGAPQSAVAITGGAIDGTPIGGTTPAAVAATTISATGAITSTLATGTAPFTVASTTVVANLNASSLSGATMAAPGAIGGGTAAAGNFTTLGLSGLHTAVKGSSGGITIGDVATNSNSMLRMQGTNAGKNWLIANNFNIGGMEFTPSTANGGVTYSTPTFGLTPGVAAITGTITVSAVASSGAAQSGYLCYNTSGVITYDGGATCLVSLEETKNKTSDILGADALRDVMALRPFWGSYRTDTPMTDHNEQPFLGAHQVESVDPRLVTYTDTGELHGVRYQNMTAVLIAAIQEQENQIRRLQWICALLGIFALGFTATRLSRALRSSQ